MVEVGEVLRPFACALCRADAIEAWGERVEIAAEGEESRDWTLSGRFGRAI